MPVNPIPAGYHSITPYLLTKDTSKLIDFLKSAFGATAVASVANPDGEIMHAEVKIGDSMVMIGTKKGAETAPAMLYLYVTDVDKTYQQALEAGGTSVMAPADQFYGDRNAGIKDPCGHSWWIATHIEDVAEDELKIRAEKYYTSQSY